MVSFTDHYNVLFNDRFPLRTKIGKDSWHFNNSLLCKPEFCLTKRLFFCLLKTQKTSTLQQVTGEKTLNLVLKKVLELFWKLKKMLEIQYWKEDCEK